MAILYEHIVPLRAVLNIHQENLLRFTDVSNFPPNVESQLKIIAWNYYGWDVWEKTEDVEHPDYLVYKNHRAITKVNFKCKVVEQGILVIITDKIQEE